MRRLLVLSAFLGLALVGIVILPNDLRVSATGSPAGPNVQFELTSWDGNNISIANASLWIVGSPAVEKASLTQSTVGGTFVFNSTKLGLTGGENFYIHVWKIGYQNITTPLITYDISKPVIDLGPLTLHGSLRVNVVKAFSPSVGVSLPTGLLKDHLVLIAAVTGLTDGSIEFPVDWSSHSVVNVTAFKTGWVTNSSLQNVPLRPWINTTRTVSLETTIRIKIISELSLPVPEASITVIDVSHLVHSATEGTATDQDGNEDGIMYWALDPATVSNQPVNITVSRPGFAPWTRPSSIVSSLAQLNITTPGLKYNLRVTASDELGGPLTLSGSNTTFAGLTISQADFSQGTAYVAADPAFPSNLTIIQKGYTSSTTSTVIFPPSPGSFTTKTISYQPNGGTGPGLRFAVKVVGVFDELGNPLGIGSKVAFASSTGTFTASSGAAYLAAFGRVNITAISPGYVNSTVSVSPSHSSQTTILFGNETSGATIIRPGLRFSIKVVGVYDEIGDRFQLGTNATIISSGIQVIIASGHAYIPADSTITIIAVAPGFVTATAIVTPSASFQATILFKNGGTNTTFVEPSLLFSLKVLVSQSWDHAAVENAGVEVFTDPAMTNMIQSSKTDSSGIAFLTLNPGTVYVQVSIAGYPTFKSPPIQVSASSQTATSVSLASKTTIVGVRTTFNGLGVATNVTLTASTNIFGPSYSTTFGISFTYSSPSAGTVNVTIPKILIPPGSITVVIMNGQTVSVQSEEDPNNLFLQVPTLPETANVQISFQFLRPPPSSLLPLSESTVVQGVLAAVGVFAVGIPYAVVRRKKPRRLEPTPSNLEIARAYAI